MIGVSSRPESVQKATETERSYQHEDSKLRNHGPEREHHEIIFKRYECKPAWKSAAGNSLAQMQHTEETSSMLLLQAKLFLSILPTRLAKIIISTRFPHVRRQLTIVIYSVYPEKCVRKVGSDWRRAINTRSMIETTKTN